jgi:uncharacterized protein (DUF433 family)
MPILKENFADCILEDVENAILYKEDLQKYKFIS